MPLSLMFKQLKADLKVRLERPVAEPAGKRRPARS
jgi:hypothetical protein